MPCCELTKASVERIKSTKHTKRTVYLDIDVRGLMLEYRPSGTGTWYFRYKNAAGKMQMLKLGRLAELDALEARVRAHHLKKDMKAGFYPEKHAHMEPLSLQDFVEEFYTPHTRAKKRSWEREIAMLRLHILPQLGERRLEAISTWEIMRWQSSMREKGLSPGSINRTLFLLKYVFNCAVRWGMLVSSPCRGVSSLPDDALRQRYLNKEEAHSLISVLDRYPNRNIAAAIKLLLFTGARKSEILTARWEYVDFARGQLKVPLSKSGRERYIPLSSGALRIIEELPRTASPWLFPGKNGDKPRVTNFRVWNEIRQLAGIPDVHLHDLRHTFASFLVENGCTLYEVQRILGHQTPKVTARYAHLTEESLLCAAEKVSIAMQNSS